jgi:hypothetical protein
MLVTKSARDDASLCSPKALTPASTSVSRAVTGQTRRPGPFASKQSQCLTVEPQQCDDLTTLAAEREQRSEIVSSLCENYSTMDRPSSTTCTYLSSTEHAILGARSPNHVAAPHIKGAMMTAQSTILNGSAKRMP